MNEEDLKKLIGKTVVAATSEDDAVELVFDDGSKARICMLCGDTCDDYPYFFGYVEDGK